MTTSFTSGGRFKDLLLLFFPILATAFSSFIYLLVEKLLLARFSISAMEAAISASYVCQIFQSPCIALAMMAQVYIGRWYGAKELRSIGPGLWQFIWFSCLSLLITVPFSIIYGKLYFRGTPFEEIVLPYFYFLVAFNFLYPLGAALSCFYLARGKTRLVLFVTIGSQVVKLFLAYLFIFGWGTWFPALGLIGGALSTCIAHAGYCLILLSVFLSLQNAKIFNSRNWRFQPRLFWECVHPGFLRALNRILNTTSWASIAYLMSSKGGDYVLILSIGGSLFLFLPFLGDAICQAQTTIVANILGARNYPLLVKAFRSGSLLVLIAVTLIGIPILLFPSQTFNYLYPTITLDINVIRNVFLGVWFSFFFYTWLFVPMSYILAFRDMKFSLFMGAMNWINGFLLMYLAIDFVQIAADRFWIVLSIMHGTTALCYFWRMKWLQSQVTLQEKPAPKAT